MAAMFMAALEGTVVGTAMPSISRSLGDLANYSWVFSGYLLAQTVASLSFGKLADVAGRKTAIVTGLAIFVAGSIACGFAWSMESLIAFRVIQGIGAGAILPLCMTIISDLFPPEQRGKAQSLIATVFGTSSVVGPVVGGLIVENGSWSWVFWVNVPAGILAIVAFLALLPAYQGNPDRRFNFAGNLWFAIALSAALTAVGLSSTDSLVPALIAATICVIGTAVFVRIERRSSEQLFAPDVWWRRNIVVANLTTFMGAMAIIGLTAFLPLFMQVVLHATPIVAGLALTAIAMGWPLGATLAGWYQLKIGLLRTMQVGTVLIFVGTLAFATLDAGSGFLHAAAGSFFMGAGMGFLTSAALMVVQEAVAPTNRGSVTSAHVFARNLGSVIGVAAFGAIFNFTLRSNSIGIDLHELESQLANGTTGSLSSEAISQLAGGLHIVFLAMTACAICALLVAVFTRGIDQSTDPMRET